MASLAAWIAPIATMIAAMMTAANLGAMITGWGFVVLTIGSIRRECLDHVVVISEAHLRRILSAYAAYYNGTRIHRP